MYKAKRPYLATDLESFDIPQTDLTVIRIVRKLYGGTEVIDVRLWHLNKKTGEYYPRRTQGLCLNIKAWDDIYRMFKSNLKPDLGEAQTNG